MSSSPFNILTGDEDKGTFPIDATAIVRSAASDELVFAVVGHVGSGTSLIASALKDALSDENFPGGRFESHVIKARDVLVEWAESTNFPLSEPGDRSIRATELLQDCGDAMRKAFLPSGKQDFAAVAKGLVKAIVRIRDNGSRATSPPSGAVSITTTSPRRAYILDALRHPAEVNLLRKIYADAFVLIGVASEEDAREKRLRDKFQDASAIQAREFMKRDAKSADKFGQKVADTFHLADFFLDNTGARFMPDGESNRAWNVLEKLGRLVNIVAHTQVIRPEIEETAMHHAHAAMMQSACLSRQVGAALIDEDGALISTGTNEVPKGGGGVYGEPVKQSALRLQNQPLKESRCALRGDPGSRYCSNTREQNGLIEELIKATQISARLTPVEVEKLAESFRDTRVGGLLEFSRAVHAEMDALLTAGRTGASTIGTRLFVTTFPCHYCARHIVSAGVDEVQYIEPYPKSLALKLHDDSIAIAVDGWVPPSQGGRTVLFRPFSGVAPRFYRRAFLKDRDLKDDKSGKYLLGDPEWGSPYYLSKIGYRQLETELIKGE